MLRRQRFPWGMPYQPLARLASGVRQLHYAWVIVAVASLVCGHVIALVLAHDRAVATFQTVYSAILAQFALLALMVLYTVGGLWILSQG